MKENKCPECDRVWNKTDYHYARCVSCGYNIPANTAIEGWR